MVMASGVRIVEVDVGIVSARRAVHRRIVLVGPEAAGIGAAAPGLIQAVHGTADDILDLQGLGPLDDRPRVQVVAGAEGALIAAGAAGVIQEENLASIQGDGAVVEVIWGNRVVAVAVPVQVQLDPECRHR